MWLLADFGFIPMNYKKWNKVLRKWAKNSYTNDPSPAAIDRTGVLRQMLVENSRDKNKFKKPIKLEFLTKEYKDPINSKIRKTTTGVAKTPEADDKKVYVSLLAGNPKSSLDPRFKGALDSLNKKVGKRDVIMSPLSAEVDELYKNKFKDRYKSYNFRTTAEFAEIAGIDKLNTTKAKTVKYNGASYKISEPSRSERKGKKYQVTVERSDGRRKTVAWGDSSREDYLVHKDDKRRDNFQRRFAGIKKKDGSRASDDPWGASYYATKYNW